MNSCNSMTRRESIKKLLHLSGWLTVSGVINWTAQIPLAAQAEKTTPGFIVEGVGRQPEYSVKSLAKKTFDTLGGINRFISKGDIVVVKPNLSWARQPQFAATTNPEVLQAVIELCQEAGAKKVRIADNTIHDARRCFALTGAGQVAKNTGADLIYPRSTLMRKINLRGDRLDVWPVFIPLVEADKLINLPVAKHHSLSEVTLGMKNWIGGVGGSRWSLHQDINRSIVDLAQFFKPTLTLIDATRIMVRNGPSGGSTSDVVKKDTLILSNDPVAADAKAAELFDLNPMSLGFIHLAQKWGLGTSDFSILEQKRVIL